MNKNLDRIVNHILENKNFLPFNIEFKTFKDFYIAFEQKENNNSEFNFPNGLISYNDIFNKDFFNFSINEIPEDFFILLTLDSQTLSNINLKEKRTKVDLKNIIVYC